MVNHKRVDRLYTEAHLQVEGQPLYASSTIGQSHPQID